MSDYKEFNELIDRLRSPILNEERMKRWDYVRSCIMNGNTSSHPRDIFESDLDQLDEDRMYAASILDIIKKKLDGIL